MSNHTLGRGRIEVNGRYIGNTPYARFRFSRGKYHFQFGTDDISPENISLFFGGANTVTVKYIAANAFGKNVNFEMTAVLRPREIELKTEEWQTLDFEMILDSVSGSGRANCKILEGEPQ